MCPWCYIGKRRLETALERFPHRDQVEVVWRSFQLDPSVPEGETHPEDGLLQLALAWSTWGGLSDALVLQLLLFEVVHGAVGGFLFWRYGLEAAMVAHAITYLLSHGLV